MAPYNSPASALAKAAQDKQASKQAQLKQRQEQEALAKQQRLQQEEIRKLAEQRRDNCSRARDNLRLLQARTRLLHSNERGESVLLDEPQREAAIQRTRSVISSDCNDLDR